MSRLQRPHTEPDHSAGSVQKHLRRGLVLSILLLVILPVSSEADWRLDKQENGIRFYLREHPSSAIPEFRAVTVIPASMAQVLAVLLDVNNYKRWIHRCEQSFTVASSSGSERYIYQRNDLPWVRDRDIILRARLSHQDDGRQVDIALNATPDYCHNHPNPSCKRIEAGRSVRITEAVGNYQLNRLDDETVEVIWQQHLNPGGKLPPWIVKGLLSDIPMKSLASLREVVKDAKYRHSRIVFDGDSLRIETAPATRAGN
jgi:hypothetical protein